MPQQQLSEEQIQALQEKIKNMNPEELKEFQKKQCIFCQIVEGKVQSKKVYEDDIVIGILDINPANPGHILLLPKEHYSIMPQIPEDVIGHIFMTAKALSNAMLHALEVQGTNIIVANGVSAGQRAQHFMAHIIPRKSNDGVNFSLPQKTLDEKELDEIAKKLIEKLGSKVEQKDISKKFEIPKKVVDADFEEADLKDKEKAPIEEVEKAQPKKEKEIKKDEDKKDDKGIDLDDIANILGVK